MALATNLLNISRSIARRRRRPANNVKEEGKNAEGNKKALHIYMLTYLPIWVTILLQSLHACRTHMWLGFFCTYYLPGPIQKKKHFLIKSPPCPFLVIYFHLGETVSKLENKKT